ncbi:MAG: acyl carrier protein [Gemmatimonadaceae bacterium]
MNSTTTDKLQDIFRAVFELPPAADVTRVRQISERKWDSLAHVSLVAAIESEFGITLDAADALRMTSYGATALLLEEKGL